MKLTVKQLVEFVTVLVEVVNANDRLPTRFQAVVPLNIRRLKPEVDTWMSLDEATRESFSDETVEVNIQQIRMKDLPEYLPNFKDVDVLEVLSPMLEDYSKPKIKQQSKLQRMIEEKKGDNQ